MGKKRNKTFQLYDVDELLRRGLYDNNSVFEIDSFIAGTSSGKLSSVSLHARRKPSVDLVAFGRRTLEVAAIRAADAAETLGMTEILDDWKTTGSAAGRASAALDVLLKNLSRGNLSAGVAALLPALRQMAIHTQERSSVADRQKWAAEQATTLLAAQQSLQQMHAYMVIRRQELAQDRKNPGEPVKAAFIATMAEAWTFLIGHLPGSGPSRNPFLRFAEAAWQDLGGPADASFARTLRTALQSMKADERFTCDDYKPHWL